MAEPRSRVAVHHRDTSPTSRLAESRLPLAPTDPSWNATHLEQLRAAGLELRTARTGGGYRERPYSASELLNVAAGLGDEVRRLNGLLERAGFALQETNAESAGRDEELARLNRDNADLVQLRVDDAARLAEVRAELEEAKKLEPAMTRLLKEQEAEMFARAEAEAALTGLRGEGARVHEKLAMLESSVEAEKEKCARLERRLEAHREATIKLVSALPPPPLHEPNAAEMSPPRIRMLTEADQGGDGGGNGDGGKMAAGASRTGSSGGGMGAADVSPLGSRESSPGGPPASGRRAVAESSQPGTLAHLAESTGRAVSWVAYAEACYKYAQSLREGGRVLQSRVNGLEAQLSDAKDELAQSASEHATLKLTLLEAKNEIRAMRSSTGDEGATTTSDEQPSRQGGAQQADVHNIIPSPARCRSAETTQLGWSLPGGVAAHHEYTKARALAAEAERRYEALLVELSDERRGRREDAVAASEQLEAAVKAVEQALGAQWGEQLEVAGSETIALRRECAALRRVAEAAIENERRGQREREAAIVHCFMPLSSRRYSSPASRARQRSKSPGGTVTGTPPAAARPSLLGERDSNLNSIDDDDSGGPSPLPDENRAPHQSARGRAARGRAAGSFEARLDQRRKAYELLKAERERVVVETE